MRAMCARSLRLPVLPSEALPTDPLPPPPLAHTTIEASLSESLRALLSTYPTALTALSTVVTLQNRSRLKLTQALEVR